MAGAGFDVTQRLPVEILQTCFWFLKLAEPPLFPGMPAGATPHFKSPWTWPVQIESKASSIELYQYRRSLGWIKVSHVSLRWREAALGERRLWAFAPEAAILSKQWFSAFIERSGVLPLLIHLSTVKFEGSVTRRSLADIAGPWIVPEVRARIQSFNLRTTITRDVSEEDEFLRNTITNLTKYSTMLESLTLQANSRYYLTLPSNALQNAHNLRRLSLCQFHLPRWDGVPFSQLTHLRLEIHQQTVLPDDMRPTGAELHALISSLQNIRSLALLGMLPHSPLTSPVYLASSCRHMELGFNGPLISTCLALLSSLTIPPQASVSLILDRLFGIVGMGYTVIPDILDHLFGASNAPSALRVSITDSVIEVAGFRGQEVLRRPSRILDASLVPHLVLKYVKPHDCGGSTLFAALKRACFSGAQVFHIDCDQVAVSVQLLQRFFEETVTPQDLPSEPASISGSIIHTISLNFHKELYLRETPLWNIFHALAQRRAGDKPAFPALHTLIMSRLPYDTRWPLFGVPSVNVHYVPTALITCLKTRRDLGYPVASLQVPSQYRNAELENGLEGLVYLEYV